MTTSLQRDIDMADILDIFDKVLKSFRILDNKQYIQEGSRIQNDPLFESAVKDIFQKREFDLTMAEKSDIYFEKRK